MAVALLAPAVAVVGAVAWGSPAAAGWGANEGSDIATVDSNKRLVSVCDMEQDGNGVYGEFVWGTGQKDKVSDGNADGTVNGCTKKTFSQNVLTFRICEDDWGSDTCSGWVSVR